MYSYLIHRAERLIRKASRHNKKEFNTSSLRHARRHSRISRKASEKAKLLNTVARNLPAK